MKKEELFPKEKQYSIIIIDLWEKDIENSAYKLLETDELEKTIPEIEKQLNEGEYLIVYNKNGATVEI